MSELKVYVKPIKTNMFGKMIVGQSYYLKSEADKVIAEKDAEIAQLQAMLEERNRQAEELKDRWFWAYPTESVDCDGITGSAHEVYPKSEVDEVIAELKADYKEACDRLQTANLIKDEKLDELRHHKFKRCLGLAKICECRTAYTCGRRLNHNLIWRERWLKLAKKFKESK